MTDDARNILLRIRNDRANKRGTWISFDESHIVLNALKGLEFMENKHVQAFLLSIKPLSEATHQLCESLEKAQIKFTDFKEEKGK